MAQTFIGYPIIAATGVRITTSGTSSNSQLPNMSSGEPPRYIRVSATVAACIRTGGAAVAATNTDAQVQPGDSVILAVPGGHTYIAAIQVAAAGVVQISPLENM